MREETIELIKKNHWNRIYDKAQKLNVFGDFIEIHNNPTTVYDGLYFVVTPDQESISYLIHHPQALHTHIQERQEYTFSGFTPFLGFIRYDENDKFVEFDNNYFFYDCINLLKRTSLVKAIYHEQHMKLPKMIEWTFYEDMEKWNRKRNDRGTYNVTSCERADELLKYTVKHRKTKKNYYYRETLYSRIQLLFGSQKVNRAFFENNLIDHSYFLITTEEYKFFLKTVKEFPQVRFYRTKHKFVYDNLSKGLEGYSEYNIFDEDTGKTVIGIAVETKYKDIVEAILNRYAYRNIRMPATIAELSNYYQGNALAWSTVRVKKELFQDLYVQCCSENIKFVIDTDGQYAPLEKEYISLVIRFIDEQAMNFIISKIIDQRNQQMLAEGYIIKRGEENAPTYENPFFAGNQYNEGVICNRKIS